MRFLRPYACAPQPRARRPLRPSLESLEIRLAMSSSALKPAGAVTADAIIVEPNLQPGPAGTLATALDPSSTAMRAQTSASPSPPGYTPQQIRSAYGINDIMFGSITGEGAGQTIAIVDAYDDPDLVDSSSPAFGSSDLARFDQAFGLPDPPSFVKLNEYGSAADLPGSDPTVAGNPGGDWELEEALDVEWAHAIAPAASIILIETNSDDGGDMYTGATAAASLAGVSVVSMSWGSSEYAGEQSFDSDFTTPNGHQGVTFVASTGDDGAPGEYPAFSPNVVAAGGTSLSISAAGSYGNESAWSGGGGGFSSFEIEPAYQQGVQNSGMRSIPDIAFDANPSTGVAVYDSYNESDGGPWSQVGGTSLSAPSVAAIVAIADQGRVIAGGTTLDGPSQTIPALYAVPRTDFNDVTSGSNGVFAAAPGYDEATGLGTPRANLLVSDLAWYGTAGMVVVTNQPPAVVTAGSPFGLSVMVENPDGSLETTYTGNVTLAVANNPGDDVLGGTITVAVQEGIATFSNLMLDRAASGYTLIVNAGGTALATTTAITVAPAAAAQLVVIAEPTNRVMAGVAFSLIVAVEDIFGNLETSFSGNVSASLKGGPGKGTLSGARSVAVNDGRAVFSGLLLKAGGTRSSVKLIAGEGLASTTGSIKVSTIEHKLATPQLRRERARTTRDVRSTKHHTSRRAQASPSAG
jgi:subtilase family serine protease